MGLLDRFKKKEQPEQAVIVMLRGTGQDHAIYQQYDLSTLEDQIIATLDGTGLGTFDGNEVGPEGATLYLYGADAENLYTKIESTLRAYPLCRDSLVTIRYGGPGADQREVQL
jgi:hypothetical protein